MARLPRLVAPGLPHLIVHRGHNGQAVFLDDDDRLLYLRALGICARDAAVAVHGYGLLPGEVRLLATPDDERGLAALMQALGRRYVRAFNIRHDRSSTPWEGRFRSTVVEPQGHFVAALLAVETAGTPLAIDQDPAPWTSAAHHLGLRFDPLVTEHAVYWALGNTPFEREACYRGLLQRGLDSAQVAAILDAASKGWAIGTPAFAARLGVETGRRARPLPRGRPAGTRAARESVAS